jgi:GAF domain-containing protein
MADRDAEMTREQRIVASFVELADTMVEDFDVVELLHNLVARCVELLDCCEGGLLLVDGAGILRVIASSSECSDALNLFQSQSGEGPCFECYQGGQQVFSEDLEAEVSRWAQFAPAALRQGFRSVHAVPMRVRGDTIGALNLFRAGRGRMPDRDMELGQGLADIASMALVQERAVRESRHVAQQLQDALNSRVTIEQAKGILAERAQISVDDAFAQLRAYARRSNHSLSNVGRELIEGRLDADTLARSASAGPRRNA